MAIVNYYIESSSSADDLRAKIDIAADSGKQTLGDPIFAAGAFRIAVVTGVVDPGSGIISMSLVAARDPARVSEQATAALSGGLQPLGALFTNSDGLLCQFFSDGTPPMSGGSGGGGSGTGYSYFPSGW